MDFPFTLDAPLSFNIFHWPVR